MHIIEESIFIYFSKTTTMIMSNQTFAFLSTIDRFRYQSGKMPILITGDHAFSNEEEGISPFAPVNPAKEKIHHLCDIAIHPILEELAKTPDFFIIENMVQRSIVDMNRPQARLEDEEPNNDYFYRQMIRYILNYLRFTFNCLPFLLDLHSYPPDSDYADKNTQILLLVQPSTNLSLVRYTLDFFSKMKWNIRELPASNINDVVLEVSHDNLGIPLLMEINEANLEPELFSQLIKDLQAFLTTIADMVCKTKKASYLFRPDQNPFVIPSLEQVELAKLHDYTMLNADCQQAYRSYLFLVSQYHRLLNQHSVQHADSAQASLQNYLDTVEEFVPCHSNKMVNDLVQTLSNSLQTIIIPLELLEISIRIVLTNVNRKSFEEWGFDNQVFMSIFLSSKEESALENIFIPVFRANPLKTNQITSLFSSYEIENNYYHSFLVANPSIKKEHLKRDLLLINQMLKLTGNKALTEANFKKNGPTTFGFILKHIF